VPSDYELAYSGVSKEDAQRCSVEQINDIIATNLKFKTSSFFYARPQTQLLKENPIDLKISSQ